MMTDVKWMDYIGDIDVGRSNLGQEMPVSVYRLFEFTMKDVLIDKYGKEEAVEIFRLAGQRAGKYFTKQFMNLDVNFSTFITQFQEALESLKIGILRVEEVNEEASHIIVSVSEDLDCSGLPIIGESVCNYDEGFLMGVLNEYTGKCYDVIEIDCWAKGGRVCRFDARQKV